MIDEPLGGVSAAIRLVNDFPGEEFDKSKLTALPDNVTALLTGHD